MKAIALRWLLASAGLAITVAMPAWAGAPAGACEVQAFEGHAFADRSGTLSRFEKMPPQCLKLLFMRCSAEAGTHVLDLGSAALCSIGYEALLRTSFSGDFEALMVWWRMERDSSRTDGQ
jgi:hypothetical protein